MGVLTSNELLLKELYLSTIIKEIKENFKNGDIVSSFKNVRFDSLLLFKNLHKRESSLISILS